MTVTSKMFNTGLKVSVKACVLYVKERTSLLAIDTTEVSDSGKEHPNADTQAGRCSEGTFLKEYTT